MDPAPCWACFLELRKLGFSLQLLHRELTGRVRALVQLRKLVIAGLAGWVLATLLLSLLQLRQLESSQVRFASSAST